MSINHPKLGWSRLSIPNKIQKGRQIITAMTGNSHFTTPNPSLADIQAAIDVLETAYQDASDGGKSLKAIMYEKEDILDELIAKLISYVDHQAQGDALVIRSASMDVQTTGQPIGEPERVINLRAINVSNSGEISLNWRPVRGAKAYEIQSSEDSNQWVHVANSTKASMKLKGQPMTTYLWYRVCAIGSAGNGPWSDPVKGLIS